MWPHRLFWENRPVARRSDLVSDIYFKFTFDRLSGFEIFSSPETRTRCECRGLPHSSHMQHLALSAAFLAVLAAFVATTDADLVRIKQKALIKNEQEAPVCTGLLITGCVIGGMSLLGTGYGMAKASKQKKNYKQGLKDTIEQVYNPIPPRATLAVLNEELKNTNFALYSLSLSYNHCLPSESNLVPSQYFSFTQQSLFSMLKQPRGEGKRKMNSQQLPLLVVLDFPLFERRAEGLEAHDHLLQEEGEEREEAGHPAQRKASLFYQVYGCARAAINVEQWRRASASKGMAPPLQE